MIDFDEIRQKVAIKHNVLLGSDDPILVTVTINEIVLQRYLDLAALQYETANRELTIAVQQQVEQSKATAGRVITDAADYVASEVRRAVGQIAQDVAAQLRQQLGEAQAIAREAVDNGRTTQAAKNGAFLAAAVAGAAALIALAAVVIILVK